MREQLDKFKSHPVSPSSLLIPFQLAPLMLDAGQNPDPSAPKFQGLPHTAQIQDIIIEEGLHTSIASDCQSYDSGDYSSNSAQRNAKYRYTDNEPGYVPFTEQTLAKFTIGNGQISN